jgi:3-oxoacyl-ACP reductase-like protein
MGVFSSIMDKIFHRKKKPAAAPAAPAAPAAAPAPAPAAAAQPAPPPPEPVDVEAVLSELAAEKGGGGNWRTSIVDLLKLLDLDSSLNARKELAAELGVDAGAHGSAEQNIALQKAVWAALAKNGGVVPASLRD